MFKLALGESIEFINFSITLARHSDSFMRWMAAESGGVFRGTKSPMPIVEIEIKEK